MLDDILDRELVGVAFEPIVDLRTGTVAGYDVVWRTPPWVPGAPSYRPMSARELRDLAFEQGRLLGLEQLWAQKAVDAVARQRLPAHQKVHLALDPRLLAIPSFCPDRIARHARQRQASPSRFVLCVSGATDRLRMLSGSGLRVGLDHLGVTPVDAVLRPKPHVLRLDDSVTRGVALDPGRRDRLRMLADLARAEMIDLVGRGVDDPRDLAALLDAGIHLVQGAALAAPEPVALLLSQMRGDALAAFAPSSLWA